MCSYPNASTRISPKKHRLTAGQSYSLSLLLEVPDSPTNQRLGMFMTCLVLRDKNDKIVNDQCQSSILEYRSSLLRVIETVVMAPSLLIGSTSQRQWITVHYHHNFVDDTHNPAVTATVTLQSRHIQVADV